MTEIERVINAHLVGEYMAGQPGPVLDNEEHLLESGIIDSLGIFLLIAFLEREFGVKVQPEEVVLANFKTVRALAQLVAAKLSAGVPGGQPLRDEGGQHA